MHAIPRAGTLEEMGDLAVYLASDLSAFMPAADRKHYAFDEAGQAAGAGR